MWRYTIILFGFGLDQITKLWARTQLTDNFLEIIPNFLQFHLVFNKGVAFSIPIGREISSALTVGIIIYLFWLLQKPTEKNKLSYYFILTGAFGNLFDRLYFSTVTDFISVLQFPIFNIADAFISVGVLLILWEEFGEKKKD